MSFTGVKPAGLPVPPDVQAADRAIEEDNVEPLIELLNTRLRQHILDLHQNVVQARPADAGDVDAGRRWVDHYVRFIVYSHGLYQAIDAGPEHGLAH
jgi:hypothetical protein